MLFLQNEHNTARSDPTHLSLVLEDSWCTPAGCQTPTETLLCMARSELQSCRLLSLAAQWAFVNLVFFLRRVLKIVRWNLIFQHLSKTCREKKSLLKSYKSKEYFTWKPIHESQYKSLLKSYKNKEYFTWKPIQIFIKFLQKWVFYMKANT